MSALLRVEPHALSGGRVGPPPDLTIPSEESPLNGWFTTHWPPRRGDPTDDRRSGIWIPEGRQQAGTDIRAGDRVLIYEALTGETEVRCRPDGSTERVPCRRGHGGIVALGHVERRLLADGRAEPTEYTDGRRIHWRWPAPVRVLSRDGFVWAATDLTVRTVLATRRRRRYAGAMTLTIELNPEQQARLEVAARQRGLEPGECARLILDQHLRGAHDEPDLVDPENAASIALLESWLVEDATDNPDEIRRAEAELAAFKKAMNEPRRAAGARILYP